MPPLPPGPGAGDAPPPPGEVAAWLKSRALDLGFHRAGIAAPAPPQRAVEAYRRWVDAGHHGTMGYMADPVSAARREDPGLTLPGVRSVLVVMHRYPHEDPPGVPHDPARGVVARYARGADYHDVIRPRLDDLHRDLEGYLGRPVAGRAYADTGPILERALGSQAGLGWRGRNTMLLHPRSGSWELMGVLLLELELPPDPPFTRDHCGTCTRCIPACPTGALLGRDASGAPVLDARRCISYLTIELKGAIPGELRSLMGNRVFGCDICQEVCPWNGAKPAGSWPAAEASYSPREGLDGPDLVEWTERLLDMSGKEYLRTYAGSPLARPRRQGMLRNLCVALGNLVRSQARPDPRSVAVLVRALGDPHPLVRQHAAWALGQASSDEARAALSARSALEPHQAVRDEIQAVGEATRPPGARPSG